MLTTPRPYAPHPTMHTVRHVAARLPVRQFGVLRFKPLPGLAPRHPRAVVRCFASKKDGEEKSWGEIAEEVKDVAKDMARKVGSSISKAVSKVIPSEEQRAIRQREQEERERRELYRGPEFGGSGLIGGLVGRALGRMVQSALGAVGEQMRQAAEQAAELQSRAVAMIESDPRILDRLGGSARCLAPMSQSSMTQSINGRVSRVVTLVLPVVGAGGRTAQAQVRYVEGGESGGGGGGEQLSVSVRLPGGEVVRLDRGGSSGGGKAGGGTIDVEWREV